MQFPDRPGIIHITWPVSQTVKTLRSQRREYGFESHTGHHEKKEPEAKRRVPFLRAETLLPTVKKYTYIREAQEIQRAKNGEARRREAADHIGLRLREMYLITRIVVNARATKQAPRGGTALSFYFAYLHGRADKEESRPGKRPLPAWAVRRASSLRCSGRAIPVQ